MPSDTTEWGLERRICKVLSANPKVDDFEYTHERQAFRRLCQRLADLYTSLGMHRFQIMKLNFLGKTEPECSIVRRLMFLC